MSLTITDDRMPSTLMPETDPRPRARLGRALIALLGAACVVLLPYLAVSAWVAFAQCSTGPARWLAAGAAGAALLGGFWTIASHGWRFSWLPTGVALMAPSVIGLAVPLVDPPDPWIAWSAAVSCQALAAQTGPLFLIGLALVAGGSLGLALTRGPRYPAPPPLQRSPR